MTVRLRSIIAGVLAVAVILFLFRKYYGGDGLLFGDANFLWSPSLLHAELAQMLHVWRPAAAGGTSGAIANASQNFVLLQALFSPLGIPLSTVLVFPFLLSVGAFSFYRFARDLGARPFGAFAGTIFFLGNPWTIDQMLAGHVSILAAVALSPLVFSAFLRLRHGSIAHGFLLLALAAVELAFDPRISIFVFAALLVAGLAVFFSARRADPRHAGSVLAFAIAAPFFAALCNGEWTILYTLGPDPNLVPFFYPPVEDLTVYSWISDFWHSLVLSAYFIHFSWTSADVWGAWTFAPWYAAVTGVLLIPLMGAPKRRFAYALAASAIVLGIAFSMGTRAIPSPLLYWTYAHVPLLALLREPAKFGYLAMFGASVLAALAMGRMTGFWRAVLLLAVIVAALPVFFGNLSVPEGYGFQNFAARPAYLRMLAFLESRHAREDFRVAFLPPWMAEQSLSQGAFYTANPFVIQSEIPVLDAKLINTASATTEQAWQAFYGIYSGTDTHPAATLARFGVKYVVVNGGVHLSAAAGITPFALADDALDNAIVAGDRNFKLVYSDGPNRIYQNLRFQTIVRTPRTPPIAGAIPAVMRQMFAADTFGDAFTPGERPQKLPSDAVPIANTGYQGGCFDTHGELASRNAYYSVNKHADWVHNWVASACRS